MLVKDKDILVDGGEPKKEDENIKKDKIQKPAIKKENMSSAWGDAFDYYLRGITEKYLRFRGRATRFEFWGFMVAASLIWIPFYFVTEYAEMPMLPYYFALATLLPTVAVAARRLHDLNKNAVLFLLPLALLAASGFFIGLYVALTLVAIWAIFLIKLLSKPTDEQTGFYGEPNENDEIYGDDNERILKKFRAISLCVLIIWLAVAGAKFEDWSQQAQQRATIDNIMHQVIMQGQNANLSPEQMQNAQTQMIGALKKLSGQTVSPEDLQKQIADVIKAAAGTQNK